MDLPSDNSKSYKFNQVKDLDADIAFFVQQIEDEIYFDLRNNQTSVSPFGISTSSLTIKVAENARPGSYKLPIFANISFPSQSYHTTDFPAPSQSILITNQNMTLQPRNLTLTVLEPLNFQEHLREFLNNYFIITSFIPLIVTTIVSAIISKVIDIKKSDILKQLGVTDILQIDATVIAGVLIFLTIGTEFNRLSLTYMTASIVYPFAISAIRVLTKGSAEFGIKLMMAGFIYLMISVILLSFI